MDEQPDPGRNRGKKQPAGHDTAALDQDPGMDRDRDPDQTPDLDQDPGLDQDPEPDPDLAQEQAGTEDATAPGDPPTRLLPADEVPAAPEAADPDAVAPDAAAPEMAGPEMAGLDVAGPEMAGPEMAGLAAEAVLAEGAGSADSAAGSPDLADLEPVSPESADAQSADAQSADAESADAESADAESADTMPRAARASRWWRPGRRTSRWRRSRRIRWAELGARTFGWLTVMPALLVVAWLLPGLPLLLAGRFLLVPMFLIAAPIAAVLALIAARHVPGKWPSPSGKPSPPSPWAAWWAAGGTAAIAVGFGIWQVTLNSPQLILLRQPGAYTQLGYWLAQHGILSIPATAAAFGGSHPGLSFASYGFAAHGAALVPWQQPGLPVVLAAGAWLHGLAGMTAVSPVLGAFAVLAVGGLTGRLAGLPWAPVGALAAALTLPEILTSRSAYAEPLVELLVFGGLCLVADSLADRSAAGRLARATRWPAVPPAATLAGLGGLALGFTVLAQAGMLLVLLPVIPFAAVLAAGRGPRAAAFTIGLTAGIGLGLAGGFVLAAPGMNSLAPSLRLIGLAVICTAVLTLAGVIAGYRERARGLLRRRPLRWLPEAAAAVVVLVAIAFAVRPYVQVVRSTMAAGYVGSLQKLTGLPADPRRLYAEDSLYWVIWYLGLPAVLLAVAGLALLARRCARALLTWHDPDGGARLQALPLLIIGWGAMAVLWQPGTVPDQPWASRTLVPVVLPGLAVCAVWMAAWLTARARDQGAGYAAVAVAVTFFTAALVVPGAVTSFAAGTPAATAGTRLTVAGVAVDGPAGHKTGAGEATAVARLCGQIGQESSVLILDQAAAREFAPVLRGMCGIPAGVMPGAAPGQVLSVARAIARAGRRPVLLSSRQQELTAFGGQPRKVLSLVTTQDAHFLTRPPDGTWPISYQLWMSSPAAVAGA